ncbi:paired amphipathic helix protein Sin3-like 2 [Capsicum chacoense]
MKRLRDESNDKHPFDFFREKCYDQSQVGETSLAERGGGSRRTGNNCAGAGASKPELDKKFASEQAINFVNKIKERLGNDYKYKSFLDIILLYGNREGKDIKEMYNEVSILLNDHLDLLDEFTRFLPYSTTVNPLDHAVINNQKDTYRKEFTFCEKVKERLQSPTEYQAFLKCLHIYSTERITRNKLQILIADTLGKHPDLIEGFNKFIECHEQVVEFLASETTKWNEGNTNSKLVKKEVKDIEKKCKTEAPSTYQIKEENEAPPQRIKFEEALSFVKKLKKHFQNDDHLFKSFFDNLKMHREEHKNISEVYHKVAKLLNGHPDLLEEFTKLLADSSAIGILKHYLY